MGKIKNWSINSILKQIYEKEKIYNNIGNYTTKEEDEEYYQNVKLHVELGICVECGNNVDKVGFRTKEEQEEFAVSALCSKCQIKYFGK
jgi:hypothetical protein